MSEQDKGPLVPYHIISGEQHSEAIRGDIEDLIRTAHYDVEPVFEAVQTATESHAALQLASIGVLVRLSQLGAPEAERVLTDLYELDDENPITSNLSTLSSVYDGQWRGALDSSEKEELKKLAVFSHAAFAISTITVIHAHELSGAYEESAKFLPDAFEAVQNARSELASESQAALETLLEELQADIGPA